MHGEISERKAGLGRNCSLRVPTSQHDAWPVNSGPSIRLSIQGTSMQTYWRRTVITVLAELLTAECTSLDVNDADLSDHRIELVVTLAEDDW